MTDHRYVPVFSTDGPTVWIGPIDKELLVQHAQAMAQVNYDECPDDE